MILINVTQEHINEGMKGNCPFLSALREKFGEKVEVEIDCDNTTYLTSVPEDVELPHEVWCMMKMQEGAKELGIFNGRSMFNGINMLTLVWGSMDPFVMDVERSEYRHRIARSVSELRRLQQKEEK